MLACAVLFSSLTLLDRTDVEDPDNPTYYAMLVRRPAFAFFSFYFWVVWGGMSGSLNNCSTQFAPNQCFTTPGATAATTTITPDVWAAPLQQLGFVFAATFFTLALFFMFLTAYTIARGGYMGRRSGTRNPEPKLE